VNLVAFIPFIVSIIWQNDAPLNIINMSKNTYSIFLMYWGFSDPNKKMNIEREYGKYTLGGDTLTVNSS